MGLFRQKCNTVEWSEYRPDTLFYKWKDREIRRGTRLVIRAGQKAVFYSGGHIHGIFEDEGTYDIDTEIIPRLAFTNAALYLRSDTGERIEVCFINGGELRTNWSTQRRVMIPTPEVPSGIPVGMSGDLTLCFCDTLAFVTAMADREDSCSLGDISSRIHSVMEPVAVRSILGTEKTAALNTLMELLTDTCALGSKIAAELDKKLSAIGLGVYNVNVRCVSYPPEVQQIMQDTAFDDMEKGNAAAPAGQQPQQDSASAPQASPAGDLPDRFCTRCRKMVRGKFCPYCGTPTV